MKLSIKKKIALGVALASATALLLASTFAWKDYTQHKTDPFQARSKPDVTLNNEFTPPARWNPYSPPVSNKVSVTNLQSSTSPVLVRVRFKEYLEAYTLNLTNFIMDGTRPILFATYAEGEHVGEYLQWDTQIAAEAWLLENDRGYTPTPVDHDNDSATNDKWFARTNNEELQNGIYGKPMLNPAISQEKQPIPGMLFGGQAHIPFDQDIYTPGVVTYQTHRWDKSITNTDPWYEDPAQPDAKKISDYITWQQGTAATSLTDWINDGEKMGNQWVLDDSGWCYWVNVLYPNTTTNNLLESVTLTAMPGDALDYEIRTRLEAITFNEINTEWADAPAEIQQVLNKIADVSKARLFLQDAIAEIESLTSSDYTPASWLAVNTAVTNAKATMENNSATEEEILQIIEAVSTAKSQLVLAS